MQKDIVQIRKKLSDTDFFRRWSQNLIELYKTEHFSRLCSISSRIFPEKNSVNLKDYKKIFYSLIKVFHPDSNNFHIRKFDEASDTGNITVIDFYRRMTSLKLDSNISPDKKDFNYEEYYTFQEDEYENWLFNEGEGSDHSIVSILSRMFLGNTGRFLEPLDISQIEGELILSDMHISDLEGLEYCSSVTSLDLSHNSIENIYELNMLKQLEELDLSSNEITDIDLLEGLDNLEILYLDFNLIEDVSVLMKLDQLKFVSLTNNPYKQPDIISNMKDNGIIVIDY